MQDKNGKQLEVGQLVKIVDPTKKISFFYIEKVRKSGFSGKRVNKDFSIFYHDKIKNSDIYISEDETTLEIVEPWPSAFSESLKTLHFWVDEVLDDFGKIVNDKQKIILRAVKFQNNSYGIIQNRMLYELSGVDSSYEVCNLFEGLSYEELINKWETKKTNIGSTWLK